MGSEARTRRRIDVDLVLRLRKRIDDQRDTIDMLIKALRRTERRRRQYEKDNHDLRQRLELWQKRAQRNA